MREEDSTKIQLANLIFMNPDYEIETFKSDYAELRVVFSISPSPSLFFIFYFFYIIIFINKK